MGFSRNKRNRNNKTICILVNISQNIFKQKYLKIKNQKQKTNINTFQNIKEIKITEQVNSSCPICSKANTKRTKGHLKEKVSDG